jgi:protein tyrosine phosphatase
MKECAIKNTQPYRRYISTQGPLPATFDDFWQVVWEQNSRVLVMLTKEEEMNKVNLLFDCYFDLINLGLRLSAIVIGHLRSMRLLNMGISQSL